MEVRLNKTIPGCVYALCTLWTLGLFPLFLRYTEHVFPKQLDDEGLVTRGGTRIAWKDFTRVQKITTKGSGGGILAVEYSLYAVSRRRRR